MCHFGQDTLSWARRGARVTGADLSDKAIELARSLAAELGLEARFLACDIYDLQARLDERFEIVFTSWGVLAWLSDLPRWGRLVADFLVPGGTFYLAEIHPLAMVFEVRPDGGLAVEYGYFGGRDAGRYERDTSYADPGTTCENTVSYQWDHTLGEVVTALIDAGLVDRVRARVAVQRLPALAVDGPRRRRLVVPARPPRRAAELLAAGAQAGTVT